MNKITGHPAARWLAVVILCLSVLLTAVCLSVPVLMEAYHLNGADPAEMEQRLIANISYDDAHQAFYERYVATEEGGRFIQNHELASGQPDNHVSGTSFYYQILDADDQVIAGSEPEFTPSHQVTHLYTAGEADVSPDVYTIKGYIKPERSVFDPYHLAGIWLDFAFSTPNLWLILMLVSLLTGLACLIFLAVSAGRRRSQAEIVMNGLDRIPYDVLLFLAGLFVLFGGIVLLTVDHYWFSNVFSHGVLIIGVIILCLIIATVLASLLWMTTAVRIKQGILIKGTLLYRVLRFFWRVIRKAASRIGFVLRSIPLIWKMLIGLGAWFLLEFIGIIVTAYQPPATLLLWLFSRVLAGTALLLLAAGMRVLQGGARRLAQGDLAHRVETAHLVGDLRRHGDDLNSIGQGMALAVDEQLRSERFKTELITNVSHDIKTPLTSIINYVDLLKKEQPESETLREYIDIIDRHSQRLKKLTNDLVDMSKASTGTIKPDLKRFEFGVLLQQMAGEYQEKLAGCQLELILDKPDEPVHINADGQLLWRVIDNLLHNVCKYSQPDTRVYATLKQTQSLAVLTIKNVSRYPLNISSDELMERFVRGDSARSTEGSGLGLAIARSLTELQGGRFYIEIDGDLFKATITFPLSVSGGEESSA
ncbi:MAG: hypothetical protein EOM13_07170 [Clostridia bacterium]|nr:hypothetical protein [Clostridia bacterium]